MRVITCLSLAAITAIAAVSSPITVSAFFAPVSVESEEVPWTESPALPAGRIEDLLPSTFSPWTQGFIGDDSPVEGILAGLQPIYGAYAIPTAAGTVGRFGGNGMMMKPSQKVDKS